MSKKELITLDKFLVKLQAHIERKYVMSPSYEVVIKARRIVDLEIQAMDAAKELK